MKPTSARYWGDGFDEPAPIPSARSAFLQARREQRERAEKHSLGHANRVKSLVLQRRNKPGL